MSKTGRLFIPVIILAPMLLSTPEAQAASAARQLKIYETERFYTLGNQDFQSYTCSIEVNLLTDLVHDLHRDFAAAGDAFAITESLESFSMTFTKADDTLVFVRPQLSVTVPDPSRIQDESAVTTGLADIHSGFNTSVDGAIQAIQGLYSDLQVSRFRSYRKVNFTPTENGYRAGYLGQGWQVTVDFDGTQKHVDSRSPDGQNIVAVQTYKELPGQGLVLTRGETQGNQMEISLEVQYATTDNLLLPSVFSMTQKQLVQGQWMTTPLQITMSDCHVIR